MSATSITFPGLSYSPACLVVSPGTAVTWSGNFVAHPLRAGFIVGSTPIAQPGSPIAATSSGTSATFTFAAPGAWGYYCNLHYAFGMYGVVYVE